MIRRCFGFLALLISAWSVPALAWGEYGHRTVAAIANANIRPDTRQAIARLIKAEKGLGTPNCRVGSIGDASYWPDCLRGEAWRFAYTFPWHYQTEPVCKPYDAKSNCANGNCVSAQIDRNRRVLADKRLPAAQWLEALAFLVHFVGDIHMPLHSGDNFDSGGNAVKAVYGIAPVSNLHWLWDGVQAERSISSAAPPLVRRYSPSERAGLDGGTTADWGKESWELAHTVYTRAFGHDPCDGSASPKSVVWSNEVIEQSIPDAQRRISQAGLRLAKMLDAALADQAGRSVAG